MEDARTMTLQTGAAGDDDLGFHEILEFFVAAEKLAWAELEIQSRRTGVTRTLKFGRRTDPADSVQLVTDKDTRAILTIAKDSPATTKSLDLLATSIRREQHRLRLLAESTLLRGALDATTAAVLLFGPDGNIVFANRPADELISRQTEDELSVDWNNEGPQPLFGLLCNQVGRLLDGSRSQPWRHRFTASDGTEFNAELMVLEADTRSLGRVVLAILRKLGQPPDRLVSDFVAHHRLSPREGDVLRLLVQGHDTAELADHLGISPHTVRDHLKNVFRKTSSRSRSELLGSLTGVGNNSH